MKTTMSTKKIFFSDDDPDILDLVKQMLETGGYRVDATADVHKLFSYTDDLPDLILLDIWMAGKDGRDIADMIKQHHLLKNIPFVFLSANSYIQEIAEKHGAIGFISKPFSMKELLHKMDQYTSATVYS